MFDFETFPTLNTERLVLRQLTPADADAVFVFWSDYEVQKYNAEPLRELSQAVTLLEEWQADYDAKKMLTWAIALRARIRLHFNAVLPAQNISMQYF